MQQQGLEGLRGKGRVHIRHGVGIALRSSMTAVRNGNHQSQGVDSPWQVDTESLWGFEIYGTALSREAFGVMVAKTSPAPHTPQASCSDLEFQITVSRALAELAGNTYTSFQPHTDAAPFPSILSYTHTHSPHLICRPVSIACPSVCTQLCLLSIPYGTQCVSQGGGLAPEEASMDKLITQKSGSFTVPSSNTFSVLVSAVGCGRGARSCRGVWQGTHPGGLHLSMPV